MGKTRPLSGRGSEIKYEHDEHCYIVKWGKTKFIVPYTLIDDILKNFFTDKDKWYPLGASETNPMPKGLGAYIKSKRINLNPRHASAIALIMYEERLIEARGIRPILLKKITK